MNWKGAESCFPPVPTKPFSLCTQLCCPFAVYLLSMLNESICFTSSHLGVNEGENTIWRTETKNKPGSVPWMGFVVFLSVGSVFTDFGTMSAPSWIFGVGILSFQVS